MAKHLIPISDTTRLELEWQRDGGVQIATAVREPVSDEIVVAALRSLNEAKLSGSVPEIRAAQDAYSAAQAAVAEPEWTSQFVELNRARINHLIKWLRTARDQAYGRDE